MPPTAASIRTVVVRSPAGEGRAVLRALSVIFYGSALILAIRWWAAPAAKRGDELYPDEVAFRELASEDQRMYREALAGMGEAADARGRTGAWPSVAELAGRGVSPFAPDPIDRGGYAWSLVKDDTNIDYVGTPAAGSSRPVLAIVFIEPVPGTPVDPQAVTDDEHYKLRDGTLLHVAIWRGSHTLDAPTAAPPFELGWRRIVARNP